MFLRLPSWVKKSETRCYFVGWQADAKKRPVYMLFNDPAHDHSTFPVFNGQSINEARRIAFEKDAAA